MARSEKPNVAKSGQHAALFLAGVAVFWIVVTWVGGALGWSLRVRALFDLFALAGFGWALWMIYQVWRSRQTDKR
jgi:threonine/homoserine/homoserine lactone efflux protein